MFKFNAPILTKHPENPHHEIRRTKLYVPDGSVPFKHVPVTRRRRKSIDNASQHTLNDYSIDERQKSCSHRNGADQLVPKS